MRNLKSYMANVIVTLLLGLTILGIIICYDPYSLLGDAEYESFYVWPYDDNKTHALFVFKFRSKAFLTANFTVSVTVKIASDPETFSMLSQKEIVEIEINGAYEYPIREGPLGFYMATIPLAIHGQEALYKIRGEAVVVFPYSGIRYWFSLYAYDSEEKSPVPVFMMPISDIGEALPPVFNIEGTYASRLQFENANRGIGLRIVALTLSAIGIITRLGRR